MAWRLPRIGDAKTSDPPTDHLRRFPSRAPKAVGRHLRKEQTVCQQRSHVRLKPLVEDGPMQRHLASTADVLQLLALLEVDVEVPDPRLLPDVGPTRLADLIEPGASKGQKPWDPPLGALLAP